MEFRSEKHDLLGVYAHPPLLLVPLETNPAFLHFYCQGLLLILNAHMLSLLQLAELTKLAAEARDNVKFLTTLERHFKNIAGGPLNGILDTLPPMMNALRMVRGHMLLLLCFLTSLGGKTLCSRTDASAPPCAATEHSEKKTFSAKGGGHVRSYLHAPVCPPYSMGWDERKPRISSSGDSVWIISRHYSDDQRMGSLFQRIAQEIGDRVESAIDLSQIFRVPPQEALKLIKACKSVLEHWYMRYMEVREKIEKSERDARWEFPKQLLFARTNYMAEICNDLIEMVEIVDDFFMFLGPELKAVTG
eukprot:scaffold41531_cov21-Tisochrysis_lutea.AAC.5